MTPQTKRIGKYEIHSDGRVWNRTMKKFLKPCKNEKGFTCYVLNDKVITIHRLIAKIFLPNPENLKYVCHINSNKDDNRVENLKWCTLSYIVKRSLQEKGIVPFRGVNHGRAKLSEEKVRQIKYGLQELKHREIAKMFNVGVSLISSIRLGKIWRHI